MKTPPKSHEIVASQFMTHKGYPNVRPFDVDKLSDVSCWYFYYHLPEGELELEIYWDGEQWQSMVTCFTLDRTPEAAGR